MIKKHIPPALWIPVCTVLVYVFTYQMPQLTAGQLKEKETHTKHTESTEFARVVERVVEEPKSLIASLDFADETLPLGDSKVEGKMKKALVAHQYKNLQTHRLHKKAQEWFPIIEPILEAYGIPNDFKYIVLVESGLKEGISHKGARGVWQFMPATARLYGLTVNAQVDERLNLRKSTIAASKYLKDLYQTLDSWTLAAAAYNFGDGRLRKQINRQNQDNYYKLKLNRETGSYVYKLISMKEILENPADYGYKKPERKLLAYAGN